MRAAAVPRPHARVIGMHAGITPEQAAVVSALLLQRFASISWDGDMVRKGCFTEALMPFIEQRHHEGTVDTTVLPRCMPGLDGRSTQGGELAHGVVPHAVPISPEDYAKAHAFLDENLAPDWREGYSGDMEGYMTLAAAHRLLVCPDVVIWILDDQRPQERYHAWACLGEYRSFAGVDDAKCTLIARDGHELSQGEIELMRWYRESKKGAPRPGFGVPAL
ncbi:hypothetical protein KFE25_009042 [Diacronema lutheri]|uniref:Uncharacterized protein n=3 Tax=Diacronema lutheri TaxID=2081491 RepID=A0A8J5XJY0_DIALT|nr:hypothetical protein KFE25_009042 [Diacronema lutheri]